MRQEYDAARGGLAKATDSPQMLQPIGAGESKCFLGPLADVDLLMAVKQKGLASVIKGELAVEVTVAATDTNQLVLAETAVAGDTRRRI